MAELLQIQEQQAQRFVHRFTATPSNQPDPTSTIILTVVNRNKKEMKTICKVYYCDYNTFGNKVFLGYAWFDVHTIVDSELERLYRIIKAKRWELLNKHGIRDLREAERADILLDTLSEVEETAQYVDYDGTILKPLVEKKLQDKKRVASMAYRDDLVMDVLAFVKILAGVKKLRKQLLKKDVTPEYEKELRKVIEKLESTYKELKAHKESLKRVYTDFLTIRGETHGDDHQD